jgi:hypothetical protein
MPNDEWLEQRLANPLPKTDPDYDAFYDATDAELTGVLLDALRANPDLTEKE